METNLPRGYNPCAVCGEVHRVPKGHVCGKCINKIGAYDAAVAAFNQAHERVALWPRPYVPGSRYSDPEDGGNPLNARARLERLLYELRETAKGGATGVRETQRKTREPHTGSRPTYYDAPARIDVPAELAQFFLDIEPLIVAALGEAKADGEREGSNLLAELAAGKLTNADFERKAGIRHEGDPA
ncbi:MAG TPA: hypothetical protein VF292_02930 [Rhodanobacteraceae bacterium]